MIKAIVAVDENWGIGKKNGLLFSIPEDMKFFRTTTSGKVCCMGYNTLLSFPGSKPLKNRTNIVLAPDFVERDDCVIVHSLKELSDKLKGYDGEDVFDKKENFECVYASDPIETNGYTIRFTTYKNNNVLKF